MDSTNRNGRVFWTAIVLVLALDYFTKVAAVSHLWPPHVPHQIVGNFVRFTLAFNPGAAFSMSLGDNSRYIFGAFAVIAIVILWRLFRASTAGDVMRVLALGLAAGGAAGNLLDRFREPRGVVDFIDIGVGDVRFWTFNVADSAVTVGALMLAFVLWREDRRELALQTAAAAALDTEQVPPTLERNP
ncbi:MAG TPA: signal peptidase II [Gemmatimonadaceae bacterium]|jgi:signal peptidase II